MTAGTTMQGGEGERLHAARRKRFWTILGGLLVIGMIGGFVGGFVTAMNDSDSTVLSPSVIYLAAAGVLLTAALTAYGSWKFFVSVDEVEVADNLWGSLIGFYAYAIMLPVWWAFAKLGLAHDPNQWVIYGATFIIACLAYFYRKWRSN